MLVIGIAVIGVVISINILKYNHNARVPYLRTYMLPVFVDCFLLNLLQEQQH